MAMTSQEIMFLFQIQGFPDHSGKFIFKRELVLCFIDQFSL